MEEVQARQMRKRNMKLFPTYKKIAWDYIFFYTINFLFLTQVKGINPADIVLIDSFYYLFSTIAQKINKYSEENPDKKIIRLGIGDVTKPLCHSVIMAMHKAVDEMSMQETFRGYGPEQGYNFLRQAVCDYYKTRNVELELN